MRRRTLSAAVVAVPDICTETRRAMFDIYAAYYEPAVPAVFDRDLSAKTHSVMLYDFTGVLRGFSTIRVQSLLTESGDVTIMYSGDTIIERAFWGSQALPFKWIEFAGSIKAADPAVPLYWLLISKGHRTYRLLPAFARRFFPTWREETPPDMLSLMQEAGREMFGAQFQGGIVRHGRGAAALKPELATIDEAHRGNADIAYFLKRNPYHAQGDELLCLCELSTDNLQPLARAQFLRGYERGALVTAA